MAKMGRPFTDYTLEGWTKRIATTWGGVMTSILKTAEYLLDARDGPHKLPHGQFTTMIEEKLPFGERTAQMLMKIGKNKVLRNPNHGAVLPSSWRTLSELAPCDEDKLLAGISDGTIHRDMEREDAIAFRTGIPKDEKPNTAMKALDEAYRQLEEANQKLAAFEAKAKADLEAVKKEAKERLSKAVKSAEDKVTAELDAKSKGAVEENAKPRANVEEDDGDKTDEEDAEDYSNIPDGPQEAAIIEWLKDDNQSLERIAAVIAFGLTTDNANYVARRIIRIKQREFRPTVTPGTEDHIPLA